MQGSGNGLLPEAVCAAGGLALGVLAAYLMRVFTDPASGRVMTAGGNVSALFWIVIVAARLAAPVRSGLVLWLVTERCRSGLAWWCGRGRRAASSG